MFSSFMMVLPIVICIAAGYIFKRTGMLNEEGAVQIGRIVFYLATPCILFRLTMTLRAEDLANVRFISVLYVCMLLSMLAAYVILRMRGGDRKCTSVSYLMVLRTNNLFMGIPTIIMLWGQEALRVYALYIAMSIGFIEIISAAFALASLYGELNFSSIRKIVIGLFTNPVVLTTIAGTAWGLCIKMPLPRCIDLPMEIFGNLGTGLALMTLGMKLNLKSIVHDLASTWTDSLIRLIISPLIVWTGFQLFPSAPELERMAVLLLALPIAANTAPMADALGMDSEYAAHSVMASTLLSIFTLPVMVNLLL